MNPLSPFVYHRRHKQQALLLLGLIALATLGVCVMVRLLESVGEQGEVNERYLTRFSEVSAVGPSLEASVVSQIRVHRDVSRAIPERSLYVDTPLNTSGGFRVFGVREADLQLLVDTCDLRLKEGRLLRPRTNEIVLSEELADALGLQIGDQISRSIDERYYRDIPTSMAVVGILESDPSAAPGQNVIAGFVSREYLESHERYTPRPSLLVVPEGGCKAEVDRFLETAIASPRADVWTYRRFSESLAQAMLFLHLIFGVVDCLAAVVIALVIGAIHRIGLAQRMEDLGLLHAIGHSRRWLIRRLTLETATVAGTGWIGGLVLSWLVFAFLKANVFPPTVELDLMNVTPIWLSTPIPLAVIGFLTLGVARTLRRLDAVAIIERGKLSMEPGDRGRAAGRSSVRPLSSWIFYLRHRRRGLALAATMALMVAGVAFPAFLLESMVDLVEIQAEHLRHISVVSPRGADSVDPGVAAQIRTHPATARVMPAVRLGLMIEMPPLSRNPIMIYGLLEDDVPVLLSLYGVELKEGRLPYARSNEVALSQAAAMNRGLRVGDSVGRPVHEYDLSIPTEMVVVGILSPSSGAPRTEDVWSGVASYEYLRGHELYSSRPVSLLVVPAEGRKDELDAWLESKVASEETSVRTYRTEMESLLEGRLVVIALCVVVEGVIAAVAAVALAVLSYIHFIQRREEFGVLHAMGQTRRWLVLRTTGETLSVVAVAWLMGALLCGAGLIGMQLGLYAPKGLSLDFLNPAPWLFTLPIPLAVVAVSAGLVVWMLSRLDPVAIIERRP